MRPARNRPRNSKLPRCSITQELKETIMTQQIRQTETSGTMKAASVADYIVERLAAEGISHCFGVAGDYLFPICDAVDSSRKIKCVGCSNELKASYAPAGYRV